MTPGNEEPGGIVYVVDEDATMRRALVRLLQAERFNVQSFESAAAFLDVKAAATPACAIVHVHMPHIDGLALHERIKAAGRLIPFVYITGQGDVPTAVNAMRHGAVDFLEKPFADNALLTAVRSALATDRSTSVTRLHHAKLQQKAQSLTAREHEVFCLVARGLPNKVVGARLGIAEKTIKKHRGRVMEKLGAGSLAELVLIAENLGLVRADGAGSGRSETLVP